ncbi:hypothetical protein BJ508DRAFT_412794 [Ascobolus immersus RN42]|uniref:F-box domain-containing protein n=1 Tax=Ascobolus immersus RN42 TaxID=1160509 RepID=A0A3N4IF49_ASCIM|nr:hypothetical protein BJ508DRAFT_412794 [Ascobolus immersus RN42]
MPWDPRQYGYRQLTSNPASSSTKPVPKLNDTVQRAAPDLRPFPPHPPEIFVQITSYFDFPTLLRFSQTNRSNRRSYLPSLIRLWLSDYAAKHVDWLEHVHEFHGDYEAYLRDWEDRTLTRRKGEDDGGPGNDVKDWLWLHFIVQSTVTYTPDEVKKALELAFTSSEARDRQYYGLDLGRERRHYEFLALRYFMDYLERTGAFWKFRRDLDKIRYGRTEIVDFDTTPAAKPSGATEWYWEIKTDPHKVAALRERELVFVKALIEVVHGIDGRGTLYWEMLSEYTHLALFAKVFKSSNPVVLQALIETNRLTRGQLVNRLPDGRAMDDNVDQLWQWPCPLHACIEVAIRRDDGIDDYWECVKLLVERFPGCLAEYVNTDYGFEGWDFWDGLGTYSSAGAQYDAAAYVVYARYDDAESGYNIDAGYEQRMRDMLKFIQANGGKFDLALEYCFLGVDKEDVQKKLGRYLPPNMVQSLIQAGAHPNAIVPHLLLGADPDHYIPQFPGPLWWTPLHLEFNENFPARIARNLFFTFVNSPHYTLGIDLLDRNTPEEEGNTPLLHMVKTILKEDPKTENGMGRIGVMMQCLTMLLEMRKRLGLGKWTEAPQWESVVEIVGEIENCDEEPGKSLKEVVDTMPEWELKPLQPQPISSGDAGNGQPGQGDLDSAMDETAG